MSKFIDREKVDWQLASCAGLDTELFFKQQSQLLGDNLSFYNLRKICFNCPIWKDCLAVAAQEEDFGFWGGVSEEERRQIAINNPQRRYMGLIRDLVMFPYVTIDEIIGIIKDASAGTRPHRKINI